MFEPTIRPLAYLVAAREREAERQARIRAWRERQITRLWPTDLTNAEIAFAVGMSRTAVDLYSDRIGLPTRSFARKRAAALQDFSPSETSHDAARHQPASPPGRASDLLGRPQPDRGASTP